MERALLTRLALSAYLKDFVATVATLEQGQFISGACMRAFDFAARRGLALMADTEDTESE